ncbi:MAG: hypothetical protein GX661_05870 [Acholeplasmataceae bacterium]|nr:hypothetical protein [Acholeplasmataceae bacterium]
MEERRRILKLLEAKMLTVEEADILLSKIDNKTGQEESFKNQFDGFEERIKIFGNELGAFLKGTLKTVEEKIATIFPEQKQEQK